MTKIEWGRTARSRSCIIWLSLAQRHTRWPGLLSQNLKPWKLIQRTFSDFSRKLAPPKITRHTVLLSHIITSWNATTLVWNTPLKIMILYWLFQKKRWLRIKPFVSSLMQQCMAHLSFQRILSQSHLLSGFACWRKMLNWKALSTHSSTLSHWINKGKT